MPSVVISEVDGIGSMESYEEDNVRSVRKLRQFNHSAKIRGCLCITQATKLFLLVTANLLKLASDKPPCKEMSAWFHVLFGAVGYIRPNPKLSTRSIHLMNVHSWL